MSDKNQKVITMDDMGYSIIDQAISDLISGVKAPLPSTKWLKEPEIFYGRLLANFKRIEVTEAQKETSRYYVPRAAVTLEHNHPVLIINMDWFKNYDRVARFAVVKHEAQHIAHRHLIRWKRSRYAQENHDRGNIAMDAVINQFNKEIHGMKDKNTGEVFSAVDFQKIPKAKADGTWMYYYELIKQDEENGGNGGGGAYGDVFDDHSMWDKFADTNNDILADENLKNTIQRTARTTQHGNLPGEVQAILDEIAAESKIPWHILLRNWMKQSVKRYRDKSILKESMCVEGIFPGTKFIPVPEYHIYADMSGSVDDTQASKFFNEVMSIQKKMKAKVWLHQFDTEIHRTDVIDRQLPKITRHGYGGTNFDCIATHAKKNKAKNIVIFTDGYAPETDFTGINVLWAYTQQHAEHPGQKKIVIDA